MVGVTNKTTYHVQHSIQFVLPTFKNLKNHSLPKKMGVAYATPIYTSQ